MDDSRVDYETIGKQYDPALSHKENAERIGISWDQLINWKRLNGLIKIGPIDEELFYKYYKMKYVDRMIGELLGVPTIEIWGLRQVFGLPANGHRGIRYEPPKLEVGRSRRIDTGRQLDSESLFNDKEFIKRLKDGEY